MRFFAATLLLATVALANPAPVAGPEAAAAPVTQPKFEPVKVESRDQLAEALSARVAPEEPEIVARTAGIRLDSRDPKKSKPKGSSSSSNDTDSAAGMISPSRAVELGALGLGLMEVVRLWL